MKYPKTQFAKAFHEGDRVSSPFLIKYSAVMTGKTGKPYMNVVLTDKTGDVEARIFDNVPKYHSQAVKDTYVQVEGNAQTFNGRIQILIKDLTVLREDEVAAEEYVPVTTLNPEKLYAELKEKILSMKDPYYKALMEAIFIEDEEIAAKVKKAPAAKSMHHAYPVGLLEHVVSIFNILEFLAKHYEPYINRDLLLLGGLMHDLGKIWELQYEKTTDYTTEGRLIGHLVMGVELIEKKVRELESKPGRLPGPFPTDHRLLSKHMVLAHHGKLEYGSPKEPACIEALIVHMIDDLDSKVNAIRVFTELDNATGSWTLLNRQFERFFYKPEWARKTPNGQ
ncbi:MAG: HD domain-containing protein [Bdellovibrionales bacterium]|nr:HD domain-containing protein [Bdellovibrionales bacterium]